MTAREVLDGMNGRAQHVWCEDCGKCRVVEGEGWCLDCNYRSCERGPHCAAAAPTDVARLVGAVEAVLAKHSTKFYNKYGRESEGDEGQGGWCSECLRFYGPACPTVAAIENALEPSVTVTLAHIEGTEPFAYIKPKESQ